MQVYLMNFIYAGVCLIGITLAQLAPLKVWSVNIGEVIQALLIVVCVGLLIFAIHVEVWDDCYVRRL